MLTRLRVQGFKNLYDLTIRFGPFTTIAGLNAAGKSNLFDAIRFLHLLSQKPIMEAVGSLRDVRGRAPSPEELFTRFGDFRAKEMLFTADLLVERNVEDEFGVKGKASISTLRYEVGFRLSKDETGILELSNESLQPIRQSDAREFLGFPHTREFRDSVVSGRRTTSLVSTSGEARSQFIKRDTVVARYLRPSQLARF
jgi:predicted ATPase